MTKYWLIAISLCVLFFIFEGQALAIRDYNEARGVFWQSLYPTRGETLYCGRLFKTSDRRGINIEHVFPMSWVTHALKCGKRKQCRTNSSMFNRIEADLHNLYPSRQDINKARSSFRFGEVNGEKRDFGKACDFEIDYFKRIVEPAPAVRGEVARAMFYMADQYKNRGLVIFEKQARMLHAWHLADPPSEAERVRNNRIEALQGNRNPFIDDPKMLDKLILSGHFF